MIFGNRFFFVLVVLIPTFCFGGDMDDYVKKSGRDVRETKAKLQNTSGIFGQNNYRGTIIRPALPTDQQPADPTPQDENAGD